MRELIEPARARFMCLSSYSLDPNSIMTCFFMGKDVLHDLGARTAKESRAGLAACMDLARLTSESEH